MPSKSQSLTKQDVNHFEKINEAVENNYLIGSESIRAFKKIIKQVTYPDWMRDYQLTIAKDAIEAYIQMGGARQGKLELLVYASECSIYYLSDMSDVEEDTYALIQDFCEQVVKELKENDAAIIQELTPRLRTIFDLAQYCPYYGFGDEMADIWLEQFGERLEKRKFR